jgi:hypothetical protein
MGLDYAVAALAAAKALVGSAPVAGPVLVGVMDVGVEICKAVQVCLLSLHMPKVVDLMAVPGS